MKYITSRIFLLALLVVFFVVPAASAFSATGETTAGKEKRVVATVGEDGVQRVEVVGGAYFYDPNYIVVHVNKPVELMVKKDGGFIPHDIVVKAPEAGIDFKVELSDTFQPIDFTPTKVGKYPIYCNKSLLWFESHREKGMEGVIEVVE